MKVLHTAYQPTHEGFAAYLQSLSAAGERPSNRVTAEVAAHFHLPKDQLQAALAKLQAPALLGISVGPVAARMFGRGVSQEQALTQLRAAIGGPVELIGLFGEKVSGTLVQVGAGGVGLEGTGKRIGMREHWPIDSIRSFKVGQGKQVTVDFTRRDEAKRNASGGLYGSPDGHIERVKVAATFLGKAQAGDPASAAVGASLMLRVLEEASVSSAAINKFTFKTLADRFGAYAQPILAELKLAYAVVDTVRHFTAQAGIEPHQGALVVEAARLHFLAEAAEIIDRGLHRVGAHNTWASSDEGRRTIRALEEHMAAFGEGAVATYRKWQREEQERATRTIPDWSPCCKGESCAAS